MSNEESDVTMFTGPQDPDESPNLENEVTGGAASDAAGNGIDGPDPLRATMAHLFEVICTQNDEVIREELTAHKHLLNNEIVISVDDYFDCDWRFELLLRSENLRCAIMEMLRNDNCKYRPSVKKSSIRLLHTAAYLGKLWLIDFLLDQGCSIDVDTGYLGYSPLLLGISNVNIEVVKRLVDRGADPNPRRPFYISPVIEALRDQPNRPYNNIILKTLLDTGRCKLNEADRDDAKALSTAIFRGNAAAVQMLLEMKANPNDFDGNGNPELHFATRTGKFAIVAALIKYGATVDIRNRDGYTALLYAARYGQHECVEILLSHGANPNALTQWKNTPLALAARWNHLQILTRLLLEDVNVNNADKDLDTPLHHAAFSGGVECVKLLLERGANPNVINRFKASPLWNAVYMERSDVVRVFVLNNVTLEIFSHGNQVPYKRAEVAILPSYHTEKSVLWVAVERGRADIVDLLVEAGYNLWKEGWLMQNNEDGLPRICLPRKSLKKFHRLNSIHSLTHRLLTLVQQVPSLKFTCRNFLRRRYSLFQLEHLTQTSSLPATLKEFLLLKDIRKYSCQANDQH